MEKRQRRCETCMWKGECEITKEILPQFKQVAKEVIEMTGCDSWLHAK